MSFVVDQQLEIDAPLQTVWNVLTDLPRYPEWNPFCVGCESSLKPGDPIVLRVKLGARAQRQVEWMTEFLPPQRFAYRMKPVPLGALSSCRSHALESLGPERTRYRSHFELQGWLMPLVRGLLGAKIESGLAGMTQGIRRRSETLWQHARP